MLEASRETLRRWGRTFLHTDDTPQRTAMAIGLGVAIGFSPFLGFHLLIAIAVAFIFNLNRLAVLAGMCANLPWLIAPYYAGATVIGAWLVGASVPRDFVQRLEAIWHLDGWQERVVALATLLQPFLLAFVLGSLICALALGLLAYWVSLPILVARQRRHQRAR